MKKPFTKFQYLILAVLGFLGIIYILYSIIHPSDKCIVAGVGLIFLLLFSMYFKYLKNKRFVGKGSSRFLLYDRKKVNTIRIILVLVALGLFFMGIFIFTPVEKKTFFGLFIVIAAFLYVSLSSILFPYVNGTMIMIDNTSIYSYETGFIKLSQIKNYTLKDDLMILNLELKNNEIKSIKYNKFVDVELLKKELEMKFQH